MKKIILLLLIVVMVLSAAACQPTPEEAVVVQKDTERLVQMAQEEQEDNTSTEEKREVSAEEQLRQRLGIPERIEEDLHQEGDKLRVCIDSKIQVPNAENLPAARAKAGNFSQALVDKFYDKLIGDTVMYKFTTELSKDEWEKEIILAEKQLAEASGDWEREAAEAALEFAHEQYAKAPENTDLEIADSTLQSRRMEYSETDILNGDQQFLHVMENAHGGKQFSVFNNTEYENAGAHDSYSYVDENGNTQSFTPSSGATMEYTRYGPMESLLENSCGNVYADATEQSLNGGSVEGSLLDVTAKEARAVVEKFIQDTEITYMAIDRVSLMSNVYGEAGGKQAWQFTLLRTINGVEVVSDLESTNADGHAESASWMNEKLLIAVDDEGIRDVYWGGPLEVTEIVAEKSNMLPYEEIKSIFDNMMRIQYEPSARESEQGIEYRITRVRLSLQRISEEDSFTTGLLVPVWNFYGVLILPGDESSQENHWPLLTINGIDGSVIDINKGY